MNFFFDSWPDGQSRYINAFWLYNRLNSVQSIADRSEITKTNRVISNHNRYSSDVEQININISSKFV